MALSASGPGNEPTAISAPLASRLGRLGKVRHGGQPPLAAATGASVG